MVITRTVETLALLNGWIASAAKRLAAALLVAMLAVVMLQVVFRYGLNSPISWTEELSKTLMVWSAFLIAPFAYREGINVSIDLFIESWSPLVRRIMETLITLLILWIVVIFLRESIYLAERGMKVRASSLPVPVGLFYAILPISFGCLLLCVFERLLKLALGFRTATARDEAGDQ